MSSGYDNIVTLNINELNLEQINPLLSTYCTNFLIDIVIYWYYPDNLNCN